MIKAKYKNIFIFLFLLLGLTFSQQNESNEIKRPKVGLVLSGGGVKGFAHIGILKVLDSLNFPIDYIAGTSMGGIIGGFYSIGYNGKEIEQIVAEVDWEKIFIDNPPRQQIPILKKQYDSEYLINLEMKNYKLKPPSGFVSGQEIMKTFSHYTNPVSSITKFDEFPIPFRCVAVDLFSGKEIAIDNGYLALAMRATMSIPSAFAPVEYGEYLFVDGFISNNIPVDVVRDMGAEFIIAVNVGTPSLKKGEINDVLDVTLQAVSIPGYKREYENIAASNVVITPALNQYNTMDFFPEAIDGILNAGEVAASASKDTLSQILENWGLSIGDKKIEIRKPTQQIESLISRNHKIESIKVLRNNALSANEIIAITEIDTATNVEDINWEYQQQLLNVSNFFVTSSLTYKFNTDSTAIVYIDVREKIKPIVFDIEIYGNETLSFRFIYNMLGLKPGQEFDYDILNERLNDLYSLGYFNLIYYTLTPRKNGRVILNIYVKERGRQQLQLGIRFIEQYNFVASLGFVVNSLVVDGFRAQYNLQFAGFTRFQFHFSYPSLQLNNFVYPFVRIKFGNIDENQYSEEGVSIASYNFAEASAGGGLGFIFGRSSYMEGELAYNYYRYGGTIASQNLIDSKDAVLFGRLRIDHLDDPVIPKKGLLLKGNFAGFLKKSFQEMRVSKIDLRAHFYLPISSRLNLKLSGYYANIFGDNILPGLYFKDIGPDNFVGMKNNQLRYTKLTTVGLKLRYYLGKGYYIYPIGNYGFGLSIPFFVENGLIEDEKPFWAAGMGFSFKSIIGVATFQIGIKEKNPVKPGKHKPWSTFNIGLPL